MKLAVILPKKPDFAWIWRTRALVDSLREAASRSGVSPFQIIVGVHRDPAHPDLTQDVERALQPLGEGVRTREFHWEAVDGLSASRMFPKLDFDFEGFKTLHVPRDWGWNFRDCDLWIVCADPTMGAITPLSPTYLFAPDLAERYAPTRDLAAPEERLERLVSWRRCRGVISSNEATFNDFVSFVGMSRAKGFLAAPLAPVANGRFEPGPGRERDVFVLTRGDDQAEIERLARALQALRRRKPDVSVRVSLDATALTRAEQAARLDTLETALESFPADVDDPNEPDLVLVALRDAGDWDAALARSRVFLSLSNHPGEPQGLLATLGRRPVYVGLDTAESQCLAALAGRAYLYPSCDEETIAEKTLEALAGAAAGPTSVAPSWRELAVESYARFLTEQGARASV
jgi:hypothetical protein